MQMDGLNELMQAVQHELAAEGGQPAGPVSAVLRMLCALVVGAILGWEREHAGKAAGLRTHMLVTLGVTLATMVPTQIGMDTADWSRVLQGILTGIGFIGAGAILKLSRRGEVRGLTTAASIWMTATLGIAVGAGQLALALAGAVVAFAVLWFLGWLERRVEHGKSQQPTQD